MESFIANCFRSRKWPAEQGVYFQDPETGKAREIDVICRHFLDRPLRRKGVGGPIINFSVISECKSLSGWNVILLKGDAHPTFKEFENRVVDHWTGNEEYLRELIEQILQYPAFRNGDSNLLYSYYISRSHPDDMQLAYHMRLLQPPVDLVASAFRATKSGTDERETNNPLWSAIQSVLSATKAAKIRAVDTMRSYTQDFSPRTNGSSEFVRNIAFSFDSEVTRRSFFHPIVFCKSRLFSLDDEFADVRSARIIVRDLDFGLKYVDLVTLDGAADYIDSMLSHFEKQAYNSIRKTWDRLDALHWEPGQASNQLAKALGLSKRRRAKNESP